MVSLHLTLALLASSPQGVPLTGARPPVRIPAPEGARLVDSPLAGKGLLVGAEGELLAMNEGVVDSFYEFPDKRREEGSGLSPWIPAGLGGALVVGGAVFWGMAKGIETSIRNGSPEFSSSVALDERIAHGRRLEQIGWGMGVVGAVVMGVTGAVVFFGNARGGQGSPNAPLPLSAAKLGVAPIPGGLVASIAGSLPD